MKLSEKRMKDLNHLIELGKKKGFERAERILELYYGTNNLLFTELHGLLWEALNKTE